MKQETTLEEAAERIYPKHKGVTTVASNKIMLRRTAWINGAKWQQERSYSEEDMIEFGDFCKNLSKNNKEIIRINPNISRKELFQIWFEQFKKK